jgi:hypothetical protein
MDALRCKLPSVEPAKGHVFVPKAITLSIWGMDANLRPFTETVKTLQIAEKAVEADLPRKLLKGEVIGFSFKGQKARFRVISIFIASATTYRTILESLSETCLWSAELASPDAVAEKQERRSHPRWPIVGSVAIFHSSGAASSAKLVDISEKGCYIETYTPAAVGAELDMNIKVEKTEANLHIVVRTHHPSIGMGVEVLDWRSEVDQQGFQRILAMASGA